MANVEIVKVDQGGANARILAREAKVDFRRVEAASLKIATRFSSAEGKRMFVRMFNTLQLNMHFISVIARTRLDHEDIGRIETALRGRIDAATASLNEAIDGAEALFKAHGITSLAIPGGAGQARPADAAAADAGDPRGGVGAGGGHAACGPQAPGARHRQWCAQLCDGLAAAHERARCPRHVARRCRSS